MAVNRAIYHHMADVTIVSNLFLIELCADELQHLELSWISQQFDIVNSNSNTMATAKQSAQQTTNDTQASVTTARAPPDQNQKYQANTL